MKKIILIIAAVVVAAAGILSYFLFFRNKPAADTESAPVLYTYAIDEYFVTNVKDSSSLFKTSIVLVLNQADMNDFLGKNQYTIRDTVIFLLRELTEEDILSLDIQDRLRVKIPVELNKALNTNCIESVYFNDFVMQ